MDAVLVVIGAEAFRIGIEHRDQFTLRALQPIGQSACLEARAVLAAHVDDVNALPLPMCNPRCGKVHRYVDAGIQHLHLEAVACPVHPGEIVYRALDAVIRFNEAGVKVGLINKPTLNVYDEATMKLLVAAPFVLVAEGWNVKTGLGSRFGTELLKRGFRGRYANIGVFREGSGGLWQQIGYQGLDSAGIEKAVRALC